MKMDKDKMLNYTFLATILFVELPRKTLSLFDLSKFYITMVLRIKPK